MKKQKDKQNLVQSLIALLPTQRKKCALLAVTIYIIGMACFAFWLSQSFPEMLEKREKATPRIALEIKKPKKTKTIKAPDFSQSDHLYGNKYISLIVTNLGTNAERTNDALVAMPKEIALAFSPYSDKLQEWINKSVAKGNEAFVLIPMESSHYPTKDPGQKSLSPRLSDKENAYYVDWALNRAEGATGVMNLMGSRFLTDQSRMSSVLGTFKKHAYIFLENPVVKYSVAERIAKKIELPYLSIDLKIDDVVNEDDIREKLNELVELAHENDYAIGIADSYPLTLRTIQSWAKELEKQGIRLASFDTMWNNRYHDDRQQEQ